MINVAIVEDDMEIRVAIQDYIDSCDKFCCALAKSSVESFLANINTKNMPDIVLMDIGLPGMSGISGIKIIKDKYPEIDVIMLTVHNDPHKIFQSICAGASSYLLKNSPFDEIKTTIEITYNGGSHMSPEIARKVVGLLQANTPPKAKSPLTNKEKEVVLCLVDGLSYKMIAAQMFVSLETIRSHIKNIYKKLHVHNKAEVIGKSLRGEI